MSIELHWADCFDVFPSIKDQSIDLILCDPPYGTTACKWDSVLPLDLMWQHLTRIVKSNAAILLFGSEPYSSYVRLSNIKEFKYDWIWEKERPTNIFTIKNQVGKVHEIVSVFYKKQPVYNPIFEPSKQPKNNKNNKSQKGEMNNILTYGKTATKISNNYNPEIRYPRSVIKFDRGTRNNCKYHPTQKPIELLEYLIKTYSLEGQTVLDFTMGSGSTGVACKKTNRNFIGIEKEKKYFEIAKQRILTEGVQEPEIDICSMFN